MVPAVVMWNHTNIASTLHLEDLEAVVHLLHLGPGKWWDQLLRQVVVLRSSTNFNNGAVYGGGTDGGEYKWSS